MLSHRSGSTSLQPKIPKSDFEKIYSKMDKKELFNELYECDKNYIDNQYFLLKSEHELKNKEEQIKEKTKELLESISNAVEQVYCEKHFDSSQRDNYLSSSNTFLGFIIFLNFSLTFKKSQLWK